ncbi:hypothetical protein PO124_05205 [Bacillus licheniformis]|nr:hypothetical protein [Bacillus licheniformis]
MFSALASWYQGSEL